MSDIVHNVEGFAHDHPIATVGIGIAVVALVFYAMSGSGAPAAATTVVQQPDTTSAAAALSAAQISANASTAQAQIAAGVQNNAVSAAAVAATAQATSASDIAKANSSSATAIAQANASAATTIAMSHDASVNLQSGNSTLAQEYGTLAAALVSFGANQNSTIVQLAGLGTNSINASNAQNAALASQQIGAAELMNTNYNNSLQVAFRHGSYDGAGNDGSGLLRQIVAGGGASGVASPAQTALETNSVATNAVNTVNAGAINNLMAQLTAKVGSAQFHS